MSEILVPVIQLFFERGSDVGMLGEEVFLFGGIFGNMNRAVPPAWWAAETHFHGPRRTAFSRPHWVKYRQYSARSGPVAETNGLR